MTGKFNVHICTFFDFRVFPGVAKSICSKRVQFQRFKRPFSAHHSDFRFSLSHSHSYLYSTHRTNYPHLPCLPHFGCGIYSSISRLDLFLESAFYSWTLQMTIYLQKRLIPLCFARILTTLMMFTACNNYEVLAVQG